MHDLEFISGNFLNYVIPKQKKYLLKYFKGKIQVSFLRYYMIFESKKNFSDHTGIKCDRTLLLRLEKRYHDLTEFYEKNKAILTEQSLENISLLESGKFKIKDIKGLK